MVATMATAMARKDINSNSECFTSVIPSVVAIAPGPHMSAFAINAIFGLARRGKPIQQPSPSTLAIRSHGKPLSTGQLVEEIYGWQLRLQRKPLKSYHYLTVRRALRKVAVPIGRASTRGRSTLWQPIPELLEQRSWTGRANRKCKRQGFPQIDD